MASVSRSWSFCEKHESEEVRFYCNDCKSLICDDCIVGVHKTHKFMKSKEYGSSRRDQILKYPSVAGNTTIPKIQKIITEASECKSKYSDTIMDQTESIKSKRKLIDTTLDVLQKELVDNLNKTDKETRQLYDIFIKNQEFKVERIQKLVEEIKSKGSDIPDTDIAKYDVALENLIKLDPHKDTMPSPKPPQYTFAEENVKKEKLQKLIGYIEHVESSQYEELPHDLPPLRHPEKPKPKIPEDYRGYLKPKTLPVHVADSYDEVKLKQEFKVLRSFETKNKISYIVPKEQGLEAWVILGDSVTEVDCTEQNTEIIPTPVKTLDQKPILPCTNKNNELLIGFQNKSSIKQLQVTQKSKRKSYTFNTGINISSGKSVLACFCTSATTDDEQIACFQDKTSTVNYILRWYLKGKQKKQEIYLTSDIELENPIQMCQNPDGEIFILCRPEGKQSWIIILNKSYEKKLKYPSKTSAKDIDFVGFGLIKNHVTISDRSNSEQLLIDLNGLVTQRDKHDVPPICCVVDRSSNVWVGFDDGRVKVINYQTENEYAVAHSATKF